MVPLWLVGEFTTHFRTYLSGWIESDVHWGYEWIWTRSQIEENGSSAKKPIDFCSTNMVRFCKTHHLKPETASKVLGP